MNRNDCEILFFHLSWHSPTYIIDVKFICLSFIFNHTIISCRAILPGWRRCHYDREWRSIRLVLDWTLEKLIIYLGDLGLNNFNRPNDFSSGICSTTKHVLYTLAFHWYYHSLIIRVVPTDNLRYYLTLTLVNKICAYLWTFSSDAPKPWSWYCVFNVIPLIWLDIDKLYFIAVKE